MLCQICKKNQATVHIQEIVGGEKRTMHFCSFCAEKKSLLEPFLHGMDLNTIMKEMIMQSLDESPAPDINVKNNPSAEDESTCPFCGWTDSKFQKTGRLGCAHCYNVFNEKLERLLPAFQRGTAHIGKTPDSTGKKHTVPESPREQDLTQQLESLRLDLQGSIRREEYELAARLRDRITALEQQLSGKESPE